MAATYNFTIDQGSDFLINCTYKDSAGVPINITGKSLRGFARHNKEGPKAFEFSFTILNQGTNPGQFSVSLSAANSSALNIDKHQEFFYDIELYDVSTVVRLFQGTVKVSREVTR
jgi:hypothetical protein